MMGNIQENIKIIKENIKVINKKSTDKVEIVCVTKNRNENDIICAINAGLNIIGENKVQEAQEKIKKIGRICKWHMIGHLQTNKVKIAVDIFDTIQSVDSVYLLNEINHYSARKGKIQEVFIELKVSEEPTKYGIVSSDIPGFIDYIISREKDLKNVHISGIMTMSPVLSLAELSRPYFKKAYEVYEKVKNSYETKIIDLKHLSMGMTGDYKVAIEEGANMVRIGTGIFD